MPLGEGRGSDDPFPRASQRSSTRAPPPEDSRAVAAGGPVARALGAAAHGLDTEGAGAGAKARERRSGHPAPWAPTTTAIGDRCRGGGTGGKGLI